MPDSGSLKSRVEQLLLDQPDTYLSGQQIAERFSVSRAAVWKCIRALKEEGFPIAAVPNRGYALAGNVDVLSAHCIEEALTGRAAALSVRVTDQVSSTNDCLKNPGPESRQAGSVVLAESQSAGRGRMGRSFFSPPGTGLYMSLLLRPESALEHAVLLTTAAAAAAAVAVERTSGVHARIKWVNDLWIRDKKAGGILTEASLSLEDGRVDSVVLGIGVNVYPPVSGFPGELSGTAGSVFETSSPRNGFRNLLAAQILNLFMEYYAALPDRIFLAEYRKRSLAVGRRITVLKENRRLPATAVGLDDDLRLMVRYADGKTEALSGGEILL